MLLQDLSRSRLWETMREMERMQSQLSRLFREESAQAPAEYPPINVWTSENESVIKAEIPGIDPESIEVSVVNQTITLRGNRQQEQLGENEKWHRRERSWGQFARSLELPYRVEADSVSASSRNGVLTVRLPRAAADKPRKVAVRNAD